MRLRSAARCRVALAFALATASCSSDPPLLTAPAGSTGRGIERVAAEPRVVGAEDSAGGDASVAGTAGATGEGAGLGNSCQPHQPVLTPELSNARDLAGTPLADGRTVACGVIYRGPPLTLTQDGCARAAQLGLRTLLDLRIEGERAASPDSSCVQAERVFAPLPVPYGLGPTDYLNDLHETASIAVAFHTFGDPDAYPIYIHCTYGRDRTGVLGALLLLALGATRATVMEEYLLSQPNVGAYPNSLEAVLNDIEQRGGAEAVLRDAGITDAELSVLRKSAVATE
ncbi:MAG: tyrosine-protein phosphatase [Polyangiaceae bacterium]